jgi:hypothetical protein
MSVALTNSFQIRAQSPFCLSRCSCARRHGRESGGAALDPFVSPYVDVHRASGPALCYGASNAPGYGTANASGVAPYASNWIPAAHILSLMRMRTARQSENAIGAATIS